MIKFIPTTKILNLVLTGVALATSAGGVTQVVKEVNSYKPQVPEVKVMTKTGIEAETSDTLELENDSVNEPKPSNTKSSKTVQTQPETSQNIVETTTIKTTNKGTGTSLSLSSSSKTSSKTSSSTSVSSGSSRETVDEDKDGEKDEEEQEWEKQKEQMEKEFEKAKKESESSEHEDTSTETKESHN